MTLVGSQDLAIALGLAAAGLWGVADFLARFAGLNAGIFRSVLHGQLIGVVLLSVIVAIAGASTDDAPLWAWGAAFGAGAVGLVATISLYVAVTVGRLSVVAPLIATYGAFGAALSFLSGEQPSEKGAAGLFITAAGALLVTRSTSGDRHSTAGVKWAVISAFGFGLQFWLQGRFATPSLGPFVPLLAYHAFSLVVLVVVGRAQPRTMRLDTLKQSLLVYSVAIVAVGGYLAMCLALETGRIATASIVSSLQSGVTIMLGIVFLRDAMNRVQILGASAVVVGLMLMQME